MASLVALKAGDTDVLIAVRRNVSDVTPAANIDDSIEQIEETLSSKFGVISAIAMELADSLTTSAAVVKTAEMEFGLSVSASARFYVVETAIEANFRVKLTLDFQKREK